MKCLGSSHSPWRAGLALIVAALATAALVSVSAADSPADKDAKTVKQAQKPAAKHKLTGPELYAIHCNRCHPERYATERTASQWKTIMLHMRVRANLPAEQAKAILKYLQEDSGK